jgi:hypothetical protein
LYPITFTIQIYFEGSFFSIPKYIRDEKFMVRPAVHNNEPIGGWIVIAVNIQGFWPVAHAAEVLRRSFEILRQSLRIFSGYDGRNDGKGEDRHGKKMSQHCRSPFRGCRRLPGQGSSAIFKRGIWSRIVEGVVNLLPVNVSIGQEGFPGDMEK